MLSRLAPLLNFVDGNPFDTAKPNGKVDGEDVSFSSLSLAHWQEKRKEKRTPKSLVYQLPHRLATINRFLQQLFGVNISGWLSGWKYALQVAG